MSILVEHLRKIFRCQATIEQGKVFFGGTGRPFENLVSPGLSHLTWLPRKHRLCFAISGLAPSTVHCTLPHAGVCYTAVQL